MRLTRDEGPAETERDGWSPGVLGTRHLLTTVILALLAVGCTDQESSVVRPDDAAISLSEREAQAAQEAESFAAVIDSLNDDNEILIALKDRDVPVVSPEFAGGDKAELASGQPGVAFPVVPEGAPRREAEGFAPAGVDARDKIRTLLSAHDVDVSGKGQVFPVIRAHLPEVKVVPVLKALLSNSHVDYVEVPHPLRLRPTAGTVGTNNPDDKHTVHHVEEAWDFTRGEGAKIGILDSGFAGWSIGNWHPDGDYNSTQNYGIIKLGFDDHYGSCSGANCEPRDDLGHGTWMAGLVGANDNNTGSVGIAPFAEVYSMKIAHNCDHVQCSFLPPSNWFADWQTHDWALINAFDYAANNGLDVLSMSWAQATFPGDGWDGSAVEDAMYDAYHTHDILLLSSTGNEEGEGDWVEEKPFVMGIGGMKGDSTSFGVEQHEEVSAWSGGLTTDVSCPGDDFCDPDGTGGWVAPNGATSASTAIAAGIAGLVRSYFPTWTAPNVRDRLKTTADLHQSVTMLNAYEAIVNNPPDPAICGPRTPYKQVNETWEAFVDDGKPPFSYEWERDGQVVSTTDSYTGNTGRFDFELRLTVTDDESRTRDTGIVDIEPDGFPPGSPGSCIQ